MISLVVTLAESHCPGGSVQYLRTVGRWFDPRDQPILFPRTDDSHCDKIHSSRTTVHCFDDGNVGKQPVAWTEYCAEYWLKGIPKSPDRFTGHRDVTEKILKKALNTIQSINSCYTK